MHALSVSRDEVLSLPYEELFDALALRTLPALDLSLRYFSREEGRILAATAGSGSYSELGLIGIRLRAESARETRFEISCELLCMPTAEGVTRRQQGLARLVLAILQRIARDGAPGEIFEGRQLDIAGRRG